MSSRPIKDRVEEELQEKKKVEAVAVHVGGLFRWQKLVCISYVDRASV